VFVYYFTLPGSQFLVGALPLPDGAYQPNGGHGRIRYKLPADFDRSQVLYNLDYARQEFTAKPLVIVEWFFDAIQLRQNNYHHAIALMGRTMSMAQEQLLCNHISISSRILIMLNENKQSSAAKEAICRRLSRFFYTKVCTFPPPKTRVGELTPEDIKNMS